MRGRIACYFLLYSKLLESIVFIYLTVRSMKHNISQDETENLMRIFHPSIKPIGAFAQSGISSETYNPMRLLFLFMHIIAKNYAEQYRK